MAESCEHAGCPRTKLCFHYCGEHHREICKSDSGAKGTVPELVAALESISLAANYAVEENPTEREAMLRYIGSVARGAIAKATTGGQP